MKPKGLSKIAKNIKKLRQKQSVSLDKLSRLADIYYNVIIKIGSGAIQVRPLRYWQKSLKP